MADTTEPPAVEAAPCRLWSLPGELRNRIYRYVLLQTEDAKGKSSIRINANGHPRPGILSTCKDIRSEALKIYYLENTFKVTIQNFDSTPLLEWKKQHKLMQVPVKDQVKLALDRHNQRPSWPNLLLWLRRFHCREVNYGLGTAEWVERHGFRHMLRHLLAAMFEVVDKMRKQKWHLVVSVLDSFRASLIAVDKAWEDD